MECFKQAAEAESSWRSETLDDLKFSVGKQWDASIQGQRERDKRPCLVMDQTTQSIRLVCNEFRQNRPGTIVNPVGDESDVDTAEILQGLVRHIEVNSEAEIAYDGAHEHVVRAGIGHWRILTDYVSDEEDEQEIFIVPIRNPFSVYWQPGVPYEKAKWAFIVKDVPIRHYKNDFADSEMAKRSSLIEFTGPGNSTPEWVTKDHIRVAEYFTVEETKGRGDRTKKQVKWKKINALEVLDERDLPGSSIPILTVVGDDIDVDGKRYLAGLIRNAKDPQRMYNYWNSKATETIALASTAPWIVAEGQLESHEKEWAEANIRNLNVLQYKQVDAGGRPAPAPERNSVEPPIQAMAHMIQQAAMDVKASMGIYDPSLGQRKGDESGTAIQKLQQQGSIATLNFSDNVSRTMRRSGRLLLEWIREYYDTPKVRRIIKPDDSVEQVITHAGDEQEDEAKKLLTDKVTKISNIGVGRYDVTISVGPSYQTKRQEAVATQMELIKASPEMFPLMGDILVGNMDIPGSKEISQRLKKMLPPHLQDQTGTPEAQLAQAHSQLQQIGSQNQQLQQHVTQMSEVIKSKQVETQGRVQIEQFKAQTDLAITKLKIEAQMAIAQIGAKSQERQTRDQETTDVWNELHGAAHEKAMQEDQHAHEQSLAQQGALQDQQAQQSDQAHDVGMAGISGAQDQQAQQTQQEHEEEMAAVASKNGAGNE